MQYATNSIVNSVVSVTLGFFTWYQVGLVY